VTFKASFSTPDTRSFRPPRAAAYPPPEPLAQRQNKGNSMDYTPSFLLPPVAPPIASRVDECVVLGAAQCGSICAPLPSGDNYACSNWANVMECCNGTTVQTAGGEDRFDCFCVGR